MKFYVTTSIIYTNASPHIGFALELAQADILARYHRLQDEDVFYLTGTDENGLKNKQTAQKLSITPQQLVDQNSQKVKELIKKLNISNDDFIRTTDKKRHWPAVEKIWKTLEKQDDLYKKSYEGLYCSGCEAFLARRDLNKEGKCLIHKTKPEKVKEENYFFKMSKYADQLKKAIETNEVEIVPSFRKKELLNLIQEGVQDASVSRSTASLDWGIPVPGDKHQIIYVWLEALMNYISALGYGSDNQDNLEKYWPAEVQVIGKDILRFHTLIWLTLLMAIRLPLPKTLLVHGFITSQGQKMSKSLGNVVDPFEIIEKHKTDALRYYLLKEIPTTEDGDFTKKRFKEIYNADLASGLGNLTARTLKMVEKYCNSKVPKIKRDPDAHPLRIDNEIYNWKKAWKDVDEAIKNYHFNEALNSIWRFLAEADKFIEEKKPWELFKDNKKEEVNWVLYGLLDGLHQVAWQLYPFLPDTSLKIAEALNIQRLLKDNPLNKDSWTNIKQGEKIKIIPPLFPRID